jgi:uroporphyrinogen-III synthase
VYRVIRTVPRPLSKRAGGDVTTRDDGVDGVRAIWRERSSRPGRGAPAASFQGRRVLTLESRRSPELALLVMNYGGTPVIAPSLREVPLEGNGEARALAHDVVRQRFDLLVLMTGVGVRMWIDLAAADVGRDAFVRALGRSRIVARGPKPVAALREVGVTPWATVPGPNTWRELLATLDERSTEMPLAGARVAVQEYGLPNPDLAGGLAGRGATVIPVPIYRWAMPDDAGPLRRAVHAIVRDEIDLVVLTAGVQLVHLLRAAAEIGLEPAVRRGLERMVIASIGPMTSEEVQRHGLQVDCESSHPKMGFLVKELAERSDALVRACRARVTAPDPGLDQRPCSTAATQA